MTMYLEGDKIANPRKATSREKQQIKAKLMEEANANREYFNITDYMDEALVAVLDNYSGQFSDYSGKVIIVFFNIGIEYFHVYKVSNGCLERVKQLGYH